MPLRALIYVTNILEQWVKKQNLYGRKLLKIPTPRFAVFYNGSEEQPERYQLKLSDAYANPMEEPELELTCMVYNINSGKNKGLLSECPVLEQYTTFVRYVREYLGKYPEKDLRKAIDKAIDRCIEEDVLRESLRKRRVFDSDEEASLKDKVQAALKQTGEKRYAAQDNKSKWRQQCFRFYRRIFSCLWRRPIK